MNFVLKFKKFMLVENKEQLSTEVGNLLQILQGIEEDKEEVGLKEVEGRLDDFCDMIAAIIQGHLVMNHKKQAVELSNIGTAFKKALYEKVGDLDQLIDASKSSIEEILKDLGAPINNLGVATKDDAASPEKTEDGTTSAKDLDINPLSQPVSGFDVGGAPPLGSPPEQQNPNAL